MKKVMLVIASVLAAIVIVIFVSRNIIIKTVIEKGIKTAAGVDVSIGHISIGLFSQEITVAGLKIYNPQNFSERLLADIPRIYMNLDIQSLSKNLVRIRKLTIDVKEFDVVINKNGKLNLNSFALAGSQGSAPSGAKTDSKAGAKTSSAKQPEIKIDELGIKIAKVVYKGDIPALGTSSSELNLNFDETFHDVTNAQAVTAEVFKKILDRSGLSGIADIDFRAEAKQAAEQAQKGIGDFLKKAKEDLKESLPQQQVQ